VQSIILCILVWCKTWRLKYIHKYTLTLRREHIKDAQLRLSGMTRVECWKLPSVSSSIAVPIFVMVLLASLCSTGSRRRVGCVGADWWSGRPGWYPKGSEHVVKKKGRWKFFKGHVMRRSDERMFGDHLNRERWWQKNFSDHVDERERGGVFFPFTNQLTVTWNVCCIVVVTRNWADRFLSTFDSLGI
jgi:hypothetical protein